MAAAVLVLRRGGLGDTLLMLPVLAALRRTTGGAELDFAGVAEFAAVLAHFGAVEVACSSESFHGWAFAAGGEHAAAARQRLQRYGRIVADDPAVLAVAADPAVQVQVFDPRPLQRDRPLAVQIGAQLGLQIDLADARLRRERAESAGFVALAPGSGGRAKCWPRPQWLELGARLDRLGFALRVVVGPTELERDDPRSWPWPADTVFLVGLSCVDLALQLQAAEVCVANDSGPAHLAAALLVPTIVLFGAGEPAVFAPPGPHVQVVGERTQGPPAVSVDTVQAALASLLH